jgi:redox-sensitive bicupin YhaK (pirin superfamily)
LRCQSRPRRRQPVSHIPAATLPLMEDGGTRLRLIAGEGWGARSSVSTRWPLFYADATLIPGAALPLPSEYDERGAYVVQGAMEVRRHPL